MFAGRSCLVLVVVAAASHTYARDISHWEADPNPAHSSYGSYGTAGGYGYYYGSYATASEPHPYQPDYFSPNAPPPSPPSPPPSPPLPRPPQFEVRLATLPGGDPLAGVVEVRPVGSAAVWGAACAMVDYGLGDAYQNTLPRLVCRHLGLPWRRAHAVSLEPFAPPRSPMAGYLSFEPTGQGVGIDGWALGLQTFHQLWQSMNPDGKPFPETFNTTVCPDFAYSKLLAVRCTNDTPVPAVRLVAYGNMTGPGRGVLQVQLRPGTSEWLHTSYYRKDCPDGDNPYVDDYLFDADGGSLFMYMEPVTAVARVACRQLGLPYKGASMTWVDATQGPLPGEGARSLLPVCNGDEEDLRYCAWSEQSVTKLPAYSGNGRDAEGCIITTQYAAVSCGEPPADAPVPEAIPPLPPAPPTRPPAPPGNAGVRLFNGSRDWGLAQVRVVVNGKQHWAAVCATADYDEGRTSSWGLQAFALLTCRELGRPTAGATKIRYWSIVPHGGLYVPRIDCKGNEPTVSACTWSGEVQACDQPGGCWCDGPIGVSCREDPTDPGSIVGYRLEGGYHADEGVVAAAVNNDYWDGLRWGLVCREGFDDRAAQVVCRSLGKPYQQARAVDSVSRFPGVVASQDHGNLWNFLLDNVSCSGQESKLDQCARETLSTSSIISYITGPVSDCVLAWDAAAVVCA